MIEGNAYKRNASKGNRESAMRPRSVGEMDMTTKAMRAILTRKMKAGTVWAMAMKARVMRTRVVTIGAVH